MGGSSDHASDSDLSWFEDRIMARVSGSCRRSHLCLFPPPENRVDQCGGGGPPESLSGPG